MLALNQYRSVLSRFYSLAAINILANMMVPLAGLCDTAFLGHLDDLKYFAGVILGSILFDYLYRTLKFLRSSTTALTAQAAGKNDGEGVLLAGLRSGLIALIISLLILGLQYPIQKFGFAVLSGAEDIELSGIDYFNARMYGTPAVLLNFVLIGWFLGKVKSGRIMVLVISLVANGSNVLLDYLMIFRWGWASWGAGFATSISQYLALFVGLIGVALTIDRQDLFKALPKVFRGQTFKGALKLNSDVFVRFLALISAYSIFTNFSAGISADSLSQNGLLIQIALLSQFTIQGVGLTTQALIGNFQGEGDDRKFQPLMILAIVTSLPLALLFALSTQFFPETIFGWFGDHELLNQGITRYTIWLLPLLSFTALTFMFEAYFLGLKQGAILRNSSIISFFAVFLPLAIIAKHFQNVDLLWLSLTLYMLCNALYLGLKMVEQQHRFDSDRIKSSSSPKIDPDSDRFSPRPLPALPPHMLISYLKEQSLLKAAAAKYPQPKSRRNSLPIILALAIAFSAVLSSGITYYLAQSNFEQQELAQNEKAIEIRAVIAARNLEGFIGKHYLQIQEMAASPFLSDRLIWSAWSIERKQEYFQDNFLANSDGMDGYAVIDAQSGNTLFSGGTETQTINNQDIDYFQQVVMFKRPVIIPYRKSTKTGLAYMYIAAPSFDEQGNLLYVTRTRISLAEMEKQIAADINKLDSIVGDLSQSPQFFLLDGRGRIIATEDSQNLEKNIDNLYSSSRILRRNGTSAVNVETINDSAYFVAYSPIVETRGLPELDWSLILATKVD
jgi:multidrug resistance protein, MATE family